MVLGGEHPFWRDTLLTTATTPKQPQANTQILLDSGTNELEVLVFGIGQGVYGVNVAKVREVILPVSLAVSPEQPPAVLGMFNLRGRVLPLIDLHDYFDIEPADSSIRNRKIIVTEFNGTQAAFQVEYVEQIYRMSWTDIRPVPETDGQSQFAVTGIAEIDDRLVLMMDFESIFDHISMHDQLHIDCVENDLGVDRGSVRIFLAEDSSFIREIMKSVLIRSGYTQVQAFTNGLDAWQALEGILSQEGGDSLPDVLVTDIEMPQMDGLALTRRFKSHPQLSHIPVVLFSSLITDDTRHKGEQVGADAQLAKPQLPELVGVVDRWMQSKS